MKLPTLGGIKRRIVEKWRQPRSFPRRLLYSHIPKNAVIVEAGAHIGTDTMEMSARKDCQIHAFEAIPQVYEQLRSNTKNLGNVLTYNLALAAECGTAEMFVSSGESDSSSSLLKPKEHLETNPGVHFQTRIIVPTITLDEWAERHSIAAVDFLWLDLQGAEHTVLKASPKVLKSVRAIYTEVCLKELYEGVPLYPEYKRWLESQGFRLRKEVLPWDSCGDALFVRNDP